MARAERFFFFPVRAGVPGRGGSTIAGFCSVPLPVEARRCFVPSARLPPGRLFNTAAACLAASAALAVCRANSASKRACSAVTSSLVAISRSDAVRYRVVMKMAAKIYWGKISLTSAMVDKGEIGFGEGVLISREGKSAANSFVSSC